MAKKGKMTSLVLDDGEFLELITLLTAYKIHLHKLYRVRQMINEERKIDKYIKMLCDNFS